MHRFRSWLLDPPEYRTQRNRLLPIEGGDGSTLNLDFTTGVLDPRLTLTRGTNATFINSSGYVELAAANMIKRSGDLSQNSAGEWTVRSNLTTTGWTGFEGPLGSTKAIKLIPNTTNSTHYVGSSDISLAIGLPHTVSLYVKASGYNFVGLVTTNSNARAHFNLSNQTSAGYGVSSSRTITDVGNGWYRITMSFVVANGPLVSLWIYAMNAATDPVVNSFAGASGSSDGVLVWGAQINLGNTVQPYYETEANAYYAPRFDYDPTSIGTPRGLLIEGQSQNLFTYSENFTDSLWSKIGSTIDTTSVTGPDGVAATTRRVKENTSNEQHGLRRQFTCAANTTYTVSVFVKKGTYNSFVFEFWGGSSFNAKIVESNIDGSTQPTATTLNSSVNPSATKTSFPQTGWHRYTLTFTNPNATGTLADFNVLLKESNAYAGNGTSYMDVYGFSLELGAGASSYIPTGASQGLRNPDYCVMDGISSFFTSQSSLTMLIDATPRFQSGFPALWRLTDAGNTNSYELYYTSSGANNTYATKVTVGGVSSGESNFANSIAQDTRQIMGYAIASGVGFRSRNGASASAQIPTSLPSAALTRLGIGSSGLSTNPCTAHIRRIKYWPYAMTQDQLNGVTTP